MMREIKERELGDRVPAACIIASRRIKSAQNTSEIRRRFDLLRVVCHFLAWKYSNTYCATVHGFIFDATKI